MPKLSKTIKPMDPCPLGFVIVFRFPGSETTRISHLTLPKHLQLLLRLLAKKIVLFSRPRRKISASGSRIQPSSPLCLTFTLSMIFLVLSPWKAHFLCPASDCVAIFILDFSIANCLTMFITLHKATWADSNGGCSFVDSSLNILYQSNCRILISKKCVLQELMAVFALTRHAQVSK